MKLYHITAISLAALGTAGGAIYLYTTYNKYQMLKLKEKLRRQEERLRKYNKLMITLTISGVCLVLSIPIYLRIRKVFADFILNVRQIWN